MNYKNILKQCAAAEVGDAVINAIDRLFEADLTLLQNNAAERAVASMFARHIQVGFPGFHVDVEYNRMGDAPKTLTWSDQPENVFPDIIVHSRMTTTNILVIELKKESNRESKERDILKLHAYRAELGYQHALFIRFGVGENAGSIAECEWV